MPAGDYFTEQLTTLACAAQLRLLKDLILTPPLFDTWNEFRQKSIWSRFTTVLSATEKIAFLETIKPSPYFLLELSLLHEADGQYKRVHFKMSPM